MFSHYTGKNINVGIVPKEFMGEHGKLKKVCEVIRDRIREHINSFSRVESHYSRGRSQREYLDGNFNIATKYRLYEEKCKGNKDQIGKYYLLKNIFYNEIHFFFLSTEKKFNVLFLRLFVIYNFKKKKPCKVHYNEKNLSREQNNKDIIKAFNGCLLL